MWRRACETIQHTDCEEIKRAPMPDNADRICNIANRCVCTRTEFGMKISTAHQNFLDAVARQYPRGKCRQHLRNANAVALFIEESDPPTPWTFTFFHLSDVNESIAGEGWVINCVEFEVISTDIDVKEMVLAARASPENENDDMIRIRAMLPLRNYVYTSWDVAERFATIPKIVLQWCEIVDLGEVVAELLPSTFNIKLMNTNAPVSLQETTTSGNTGGQALIKAAPIEDGGAQEPRFDDEPREAREAYAEESSSDSSSDTSNSSTTSKSSSSSSGSSSSSRPRAKARVGPAAKPKAAPAPAAVAGAGYQRPWGRLNNPTVTVVLDGLGILDYEDGKICVLCTQHDPVGGQQCMRFRTIKRGGAKNLVAGAFTEWLRVGRNFPNRNQRKDHMDIALKNLAFDRRDDARRYLMSQPNGPELIAEESGVPADESREPPSCY